MPIITANGINIFFKAHGKENNPALILAAGLTRDNTIWDSVIKYLINDFYVIVYDNRGAGQSDKPEGPYTTEILGDDIASIIDHLKFNSAYIVGHSMGGFAAQYLAAKYPKKIAGLVLCSTCAKQPKAGIAYLNERLKLVRAGVATLESMIKTSLPWLYTENFLTEEKIQAIIKAAQNNPNPQPNHSLEAQILACINHDATKILPMISAPTLVITGKEDKIMTPEVSRSLADRIKNADLVLIDNAAHMIQTEAPEALCQIIKSFAKKNRKQ